MSSLDDKRVVWDEFRVGFPGPPDFGLFWTNPSVDMIRVGFSQTTRIGRSVDEEVIVKNEVAPVQGPLQNTRNLPAR